MNAPIGRLAITRLYLLVLFLELVGEIVAHLTGKPVLIALTKPLLMPILAGVVWLEGRSAKPRNAMRLLLAALFFSWAGDLFLMAPLFGMNAFVFGLGAFLLAHVCYIILFAHGHVRSSAALLLRQPLAKLAIMVYVAVLLWIFHQWGNDSFAEMRMPVIVYTVVIFLMVLTAVHRKGVVPTGSFRWVFGGALLFMISDSVIGISRFTGILAGWELSSRVFIMITYGLGQWCIVNGVLRSGGGKPVQEGRSSISM